MLCSVNRERVAGHGIATNWIWKLNYCYLCDTYYTHTTGYEWDEGERGKKKKKNTIVVVWLCTCVCYILVGSRKKKESREDPLLNGTCSAHRFINLVHKCSHALAVRQQQKKENWKCVECVGSNKRWATSLWTIASSTKMRNVQLSSSHGFVFFIYLQSPVLWWLLQLKWMNDRGSRLNCFFLLLVDLLCQQAVRYIQYIDSSVWWPAAHL